MVRIFCHLSITLRVCIHIVPTDSSFMISDYSTTLFFECCYRLTNYLLKLNNMSLICRQKSLVVNFMHTSQKSRKRQMKCLTISFSVFAFNYQTIPLLEIIFCFSNLLSLRAFRDRFNQNLNEFDIHQHKTKTHKKL